MDFFNIENEWTQSIDLYRTRLNSLSIPNDVTTIQAKYILSELDTIYSAIRPMYGDIRATKESCDSLIDRIRRKAEINGTNTERRKASGVLAVENVEMGDDTVDLYKMQASLIKKKDDLESLLDIIRRKQEMIITFSGLLKVESQIVGY